MARKKSKRSKQQVFNKEEISNSTESEPTELLKTDESLVQDEIESVKQHFTILGAKKRSKTEIVKRVLPQWLKCPEIVDSDLSSGPILSELKINLDSNLLSHLEADSIERLFPIQERVFSWLIQCEKDYQAGRWVRDTCISMPTGSGKTLSYVLPIIQLLKSNYLRAVRCLIVLPVQELASQVYEIVSRYCQNSGLKAALTSGAHSFEEEQKKLIYKTARGQSVSNVDIIVSTPHRLIDHIRKTKGFSLSALRFLVIDEADRANDWLQYLPSPHSKALSLTIANIRQITNMPAQKLLLSATLSQDPEKLSRLGLFRPILFTSVSVDLEKVGKDLNLDESVGSVISRYGNPKELIERVVECPILYKPLAVYQLLTSSEQIEKTLIFTNSCDSAHRLTILLQSLLSDKNVSIAELSAQLGPRQREETHEKFVNGTIQILISSDALARGLDIPKIALVISYDLPKYVKAYIHRAGRTGRGGNSGVAVSLLVQEQVQLFSKMLQKVGKTMPKVEKNEFEEIANLVKYQEHLDKLKDKLSFEQEQHLRKLKSRKRKRI